MAAIVASREELSLGKTFVYSLLLHGLLATTMLVAAFVQQRGSKWGGAGGGSGAVKVNLVGQLAGIPMPTPPVVTESKMVDPTKGLHKEEPKPKPPEPPTDAKKIPKFEKEKPQKVISRPSPEFNKKAPPPPENAVPYGRGGTPSIPTGYGTSPTGPAGTQGGVAMQGQGGGDFAGRYPWYVEAMKRRIQQNWLQSTIDPAARASSSIHGVVTFRIYRDGTVKDVRVSQTSGNGSFDNSGVRAVLNSSPMPALPGDYPGSYVDVIFDFLPPGSR